MSEISRCECCGNLVNMSWNEGINIGAIVCALAFEVGDIELSEEEIADALRRSREIQIEHRSSASLHGPSVRISVEGAAG